MGARTVTMLALAAALFCGRTPPAFADTPVCGDVNRSGAVTSSDALLLLKGGVGQDVDLVCPAPATPLGTGQTTCYDAGGATMPCTGSTQDAALGFGVERMFSDNGDGTITDHATGLMWEKLSNDGSIHDVDNVYTWSSAFLSKVNALRTAAFAGHSDWRVPNRRELETLVSLGAADPSTFGVFNSGCGAACTVLTCSCTASTYYWSSTSLHAQPLYAWQVLFESGHTEWTPKPGIYPVRAVRSAP